MGIDERAAPDPARRREHSRPAAPAKPGRRPRGGGLGAACRRLWRLGVAAVAILLLGLGLFALALARGPVPLPGLAPLAERAFAGVRDGVGVEIGAVRLSLVEGRLALDLLEVGLIDAPTGETLLAVPRLTARFSAEALLLGRLAPVSVTAIGPVARLVRERDGRFRVDIGADGTGLDGTGSAARPPASPATDGGGFEAVRRLVEGLAGRAPPPPGAEVLERAGIEDATVVFRNAATGTVWRAEGASLAIERGAAGLSGEARVPVSTGGGETTVLVATGTMARDRPDARLALEIEDLRLDGLGREIAEVAWLAPVEAPLSGRLAARLAADGGLDDIEATLTAGAGRFRGRASSLPFAGAEARLAYARDDDRLAIERLTLESSALEAALSGSVALARGEGAAVTGLDADLALGPARLDLPETLSEPVAFDAGRLALVATLDPPRIEIAEAGVTLDDLHLSASGRLGLDAAETAQGALRVEARGARVADVKAFWPVGAGENARAWVRENLVSGRIPRAVAHLRLGRGEALALDFAFEEVVSRVLDTLPPITGGAGTASVTLDDFVLALESGETDAGAGGLDLAGSSVRISDFDGAVTSADIDLDVSGPLAGALALVARPPLRLLDRLGTPLDDVTGRARVEARLALPLVDDLPIEAVEAEVAATLDDVGLAVTREGRRVALASERLRLDADTRALSLAGEVRTDGVVGQLDWRERYGPGPGGRTVALDGRVEPGGLDVLGLDLPGVTGAIGFALALAQDGEAPARVEIDADLAETAIDPPAIAWDKPAGVPGRLALAVSLGETTAIERLDVEAAGLSAEGGLRLDAEDALAALALDRLAIGDLADLSLEARAVGAGYDVTVGGRMLDVALFDPAAGDAAEGDAPAPFGLGFALERLVIVPEVVVTPARGRISRAPDGRIDARFDGRVNGFAAASGTLRLPPGAGDGRLSVEAPDAGAFLRATGLATEARGGTLALDARLVGGSTGRIEGTARLTEVRLTEGSAFQRILRQGNAETTIEGTTGGIGFDAVELPFRYEEGAEGGVLRLDGVVATSAKLAVTLRGTIEPASGRLALSGVASPAYAISDFLDDIPVLGRLLTGARGEGILGLSFTVGGTIEEPDIDVNPLSLLAPGFLRGLLTGSAAPTSEPVEPSPETDSERRRDAQSRRFREQLGPRN